MAATKRNFEDARKKRIGGQRDRKLKLRKVKHEENKNKRKKNRERTQKDAF
jgi:hypothetical protein